MSSEITVRQDGMAECAFTGPRSAIWHGLGQELQTGASIETWTKSAGMDFEVLESGVSFNAVGEDINFPGKKALFRSDSKLPLSIVGSDFKIVQPRDVLEFFRDLVNLYGMQLSTAGTLFEGRRFWALADMDGSFNVTDGDEVKQYLLLTTAVDGSMATTAKVVATRVVCNNTLTMAMGEKSSSIARVTHKRVFDPEQVHLDLGVIDQGWKNMKETMRKLADFKMTPEDTHEFFRKEFFDPNKAAKDQSAAVAKKVAEICSKAINGSGSDMSRGTAWGALCGATEYFTHGTGRRSASNQFWESYHGELNSAKTKIFNHLAALVAA